MKKKIIIVCAFVVLAALCVLGSCSFGGDKSPSAPAEPASPTGTPESVSELAIVVSADELATLDAEYPQLKKLDLSGSVCYEAIMEYISAHPDVDVSYTVSIGGKDYAHDTASLSLEKGGFDMAELSEKLAYLPALSSLSFDEPDFGIEELGTLKEAYPELSVDYSVSIMGKPCELDTAELDLNSLSSADVAGTAAKLSLLPALERIDLSSSALSKADVALIRDAAPTAAIDYPFELFGRSVNALDTNILYDEVDIGDGGEAAVREALELLADGSRLCFDMCGFSNEVMASIRDDFPNHKVVWRVFFGEYFSMLTDEETVRAIFDLHDGTTENLKYCTEVKYMDIGHNSDLTEVDFIAYMTKLEICIMSGSPFTNTSVFANCPNLEWLELVYCPNVTDISALEGLPSLKYLNLTYTQVTDISMLGSDVPLERFFFANNRLTAEQIAEFEAMHPECWCTYDGFEYGYGWRYDNAELNQFSECYLKLREVFRYHENYYNTKNWQPKQ